VNILLDMPIRDVARADVRGGAREQFERRIRNAVRYADPCAWAVAAAATALAEGPAAPALADRARVGLLVVSPEGPSETIRALAAALKDGQTSPLRYPAANPGSLAGVACIALGFRGPTLAVLGESAHGARLGLFMAGRWLARGAVTAMMVAACHHDADGTWRCRAVALAAGTAPDNQTPPDALVSWLAGMEADTEAACDRTT